MKLTYWVCPHLNDSECYNIRTKTKKEAVATRLEWGAENYGEVEKVVLEFDDSFELMEYCLGENRGFGLKINDGSNHV
jgi:hypothetical protein